VVDTIQFCPWVQPFFFFFFNVEKYTLPILFPSKNILSVQGIHPVILTC